MTCQTKTLRILFCWGYSGYLDLLAYSRTSTEVRKFESTDLNQIVEEVKEDLKEYHKQTSYY